MDKKYTPQELQDICDHLNERELNAKRAERESIKFKQVQFLLDKVGYVFSGTITGMADWGIYVEINENKCEGLIRADDISGDIDKNKYKVNLLDGRTFRLGDTIMVNVSKVSLLKKEIYLQLF